MAELGMFPAIEELGPIAACVTEIDMDTLEVLPTDLSRRQVVFIAYPEMIEKDAAGWPVQLRR